MGIVQDSEKRFEEDIESFLVSAQGGYTKTTDTYDAGLGLYVGTLINFIKILMMRMMETVTISTECSDLKSVWSNNL